MTVTVTVTLTLTVNCDLNRDYDCDLDRNRVMIMTVTLTVCAIASLLLAPLMCYHVLSVYWKGKCMHVCMYTCWKGRCMHACMYTCTYSRMYVLLRVMYKLFWPAGLTHFAALCILGYCFPYSDCVSIHFSSNRHTPTRLPCLTHLSSTRYRTSKVAVFVLFAVSALV